LQAALRRCTDTADSDAASRSAASVPGTLRKVAFVVNHAAFFVSHRLPIALAARHAGYDVALLTGQAGSVAMESSAEGALAACGIRHTRVRFTPSGINPFKELFGLAQLAWQLRRQRPDLVHCASPKGLLYGGLAARLSGARGIVLAVSGMGYACTETGHVSVARRCIGVIYRALVRLAYGHRNKRIIVQNRDDLHAIVEAKLASEHEVQLIPGSGVDLPSYQAWPIEGRPAIVLLPARILIDKGVLEFVEAATLLQGLGWRFILAGTADYANPSSLSQQTIEAWQARGVLEWAGHVHDMAALYGTASIVCLPSYREGMPKALLEAAASGCAVVTTDVTGCREAIIPGVTGDLVPVRDGKALAATLRALMLDRARRERYGHAGRTLAQDRYGIDAVIDRTLELYKELSDHA